jgi:hypothetical protein
MKAIQTFTVPRRERSVAGLDPCESEHECREEQSNATDDTIACTCGVETRSCASQYEKLAPTKSMDKPSGRMVDMICSASSFT